MPVQCFYQLSHEVTQLSAGQFVGLMCSRERNERIKEIICEVRFWRQLKIEVMGSNPIEITLIFSGEYFRQLLKLSTNCEDNHILQFIFKTALHKLLNNFFHSSFVIWKSTAKPGKCQRNIHEKNIVSFSLSFQASVYYCRLIYLAWCSHCSVRVELKQTCKYLVCFHESLARYGNLSFCRNITEFIRKPVEYF